MSSHSALVRFLLLGSLMLPASAFAQFAPPAGSAGAGNSAISGIPYGPANPSVVGDPSGIGNASRAPPVGTNAPAPSANYGAISSQPSRVVTRRYVGVSQRIIGPRHTRSRRAPVRPRGRIETSTFTGICRGC